MFFGGGNEGARKITWIPWNKVLISTKNRYLGIGSLHALNLALTAKRWWRFRTKEGSIWKDSIATLHGVDGGLGRNMPSIFTTRTGGGGGLDKFITF